ncbi:MAG: hypothetical protein KGI00_04805 [Candidatus Micrarchaeota archaeon]|nr:hypothetical protein [Candidatus Micrarchaeota archaeon]MDE1824674.1 hypothetical protein [Candidatus Micrarchaeota archaeon]MDE1850020.1 hypothetical protein [Candidatus Micrarchaeota archaeon]
MAEKKAEKWKNKVWFNVYPPKMFGESNIGEIPADDEKNLIGRVIKVNMSWITHKPEHSFVVVGLRVVNVNGEMANTEINYIEQTYSYMHSLVKRHSSVVYTVDRLKDKNNRGFVLKLVAVTAGKITTPKKAGIRTAISQFVNDYASSRNVEEIMADILENKMQDQAMMKLDHIALINKLELKKIEL